MEKIFLGIDVGTGSVRAGAFNRHGKLKAKAEWPIKIWKPKPGFVEQSSDDIWRAAAKAVGQCLRNGNIPAASVKGISFDATCSLVALGDGFEPVSVSPTNKKNQNIIVWMDHRAIQQADRINATGHEVLTYVGGKISPEMECPKLLWLKENHKTSWKQAKKFIDLADYMVFRATGCDSRSLCTSVCKWTYLGQEGLSGGYRRDFFQEIGLSDLFDRNLVPENVFPMGFNAGGLTKEAAREWGLEPGTPVGVGIIDAHAGGVGSLSIGSADADSFEQSLALIGGTSSCHMAVSVAPRFIPGIWGPYYGAMIPGMWLNEGGQSATGALIDYAIRNTASYAKIKSAAKAEGIDPYTFLNREISILKKKDGLKIVEDLHILPYHHGNRSPRADARATGMVSGLTLGETIKDAALIYYATLQAIAYGTRHIIESMNEKGYRINKIHLSGGHLKNRLLIQETADITGCEITLPREPEAVLLGSAILGAVAAGECASISDGIKAMVHSAGTIRPDTGTISFHTAKYGIFKEMYAFQKRSREKMKNI